MLRSLLTAGLISLSVLVPEARAVGISPGHEDLVEAVHNSGVAVLLNPKDCWTTMSDAAGFYAPSEKVLVVCQDNAQEPAVQVAWTDNDLDTLRHEAHHVLQDCAADGEVGGYTGLFFEDKDQLMAFLVESTLSKGDIERIIEVYTENGADELTVLLELEAFAVARDINPETIANAIQNICPAR